MKRILYILIVILIGSMNSYAQKSSLTKGEYYFKQMAYPAAIPYFQKALKKDAACQQAIFRLAECYRLTNNREQAEIYYGKAVQQPTVTSLQKFYYGQALMNNGKYAQARKWMEDFLIENKDDGRGQSFVRAIDTYQNFFVDSNNYALTNISINSTNADFGAALYQDGIVFASSRKRTEMIERKHSWTNQPFLDLYYCQGKENKFRAPELFSEKLQTKFNDGPVCFSKNGEEIFFTRNNIESGKVHKSTDKTVKLKIFSSKTKGGNDWGSIESFPYNNDNYNVAHPALSIDGTKLYFSSDMPGGKGGMDLYVCERQGKSWSKPVNLGDTVNSKGNEVFPTVTDDGTLYYSSDGKPGIGGLDIFYTHDLGGVYTTPVNAGYPLNTSDDDFGFVYDMKNKIGYLSSNRANRGFDDDIYTFKKKSIRIKGIVVNKENGQPLKEAKVDLINNGSQVSFTTSENGRFDFPGDFEQNYEIKGSATDFGDTTLTFATTSSPADPFVRIELGKPALFTMSILVIDADTKEPIPGAVIKDEQSDKSLGSTDASGRYIQPVIPEKDEQLVVAVAGYRPKIIMLKGQAGETPQNLSYTVELTSAHDVYPYEGWYKIIYFDLDKFNVRDDATKTMEEIAAFLKEHPDVKILINSHTDSRATKEYNERLSQNRSKTAKDYLIEKGVSKSSIGKLSWSGESVLVNNCGDGEPCTEEMHQLNRRTEFTVISVKK